MSRLIKNIIGARYLPGELGVEVEAEFDGPAPVNDIGNWRYHLDNSLRNGAEFVTNGAIKTEQLEPMLLELYGRLPNPQFTQRTSIHCHYNQLDSQILHVLNKILGFWVLEDCIMQLCASHRRGNLFCLPWKLAEGQVEWFVNDYRASQRFTTFSPERHKYACLNLANMARIGTLEFRALEGTADIEKISWMFLGIHELFKNLSTFDDPKQLFDWFYSTKNVDVVLDRLVPNELGRRIKLVKDYSNRIKDSIVQLSYAAYLNWDREKGKKDIEYKPTPVPDNAPMGDMAAADFVVNEWNRMREIRIAPAQAPRANRPR
jgi:hypothetical protein